MSPPKKKRRLLMFKEEEGLTGVEKLAFARAKARSARRTIDSDGEGTGSGVDAVVEEVSHTPLPTPLPPHPQELGSVIGMNQTWRRPREDMEARTNDSDGEGTGSGVDAVEEEVSHIPSPTPLPPHDVDAALAQELASLKNTVRSLTDKLRIQNSLITRQKNTIDEQGRRIDLLTNAIESRDETATNRSHLEIARAVVQHNVHPKNEIVFGPNYRLLLIQLKSVIGSASAAERVLPILYEALLGTAPPQTLSLGSANSIAKWESVYTLAQLRNIALYLREGDLPWGLCFDSSNRWSKQHFPIEIFYWDEKLRRPVLCLLAIPDFERVKGAEETVMSICNTGNSPNNPSSSFD